MGGLFLLWNFLIFECWIIWVLPVFWGWGFKKLCSLFCVFCSNNIQKKVLSPFFFFFFFFFKLFYFMRLVSQTLSLSFLRFSKSKMVNPQTRLPTSRNFHSTYHHTTNKFIVLSTISVFEFTLVFVCSSLLVKNLISFVILETLCSTFFSKNNEKLFPQIDGKSTKNP